MTTPPGVVSIGNSSRRQFTLVQLHNQGGGQNVPTLWLEFKKETISPNACSNLRCWQVKVTGGTESPRLQHSQTTLIPMSHGCIESQWIQKIWIMDEEGVSPPLTRVREDLQASMRDKRIGQMPNQQSEEIKVKECHTGYYQGQSNYNNKFTSYRFKHQRISGLRLLSCRVHFSNQTTPDLMKKGAWASSSNSRPLKPHASPLIH